MQMLSREARRSGCPSMGQVPEKTLPDPGGAGSNGGSRLAGPSAVAMARPYSPARSTENPLSRAQERLVSLPQRGRGRQLGVGFSKLFFSSFIPPYLHASFPRKAWFSHCTWWSLQKKENGIGPFSSKGWSLVAKGGDN